MQSIKIAIVPGKKDDPNYAPVRGHVPVELYKKFKIFCLDRGVDNSEGLEQLLAEYFEDKQSPQPDPPAKGKGSGSTAKRRGKAGGEG